MNYNNICMVGICGAGMAPLAIYLSQRGNNIFGWDDYSNTEVQDLLVENKVVLLPEKLLPIICECVVRSGAVDEATDEICLEAARRNIPILRRGEFLAKVCGDRKLISVIGSHGKTSITANCIEILKKNDIIFDYVLGGFFNGNVVSPAQYNPLSEYIVAEVDESDGTMKNFSSEYAIALNYDDDHLHNYGSRENFIQAFEDFFSRTRQKIFVSAVDGIFMGLAAKHGNKRVALQLQRTKDCVESNKMVAQACLEEIFDRRLLIPEKFVGVQRRHEVMFQSDNLTIINDYAHHPTEIDALLKYSRFHYHGYELNIVFQPHRVTRTKQYFAEFANALSSFDRVYVVELYDAFEKNGGAVSSSLIFDHISNQNKKYVSLTDFDRSMHGVLKEIRSANKKQLLMFVGAGSILCHAKRFVNEMAFQRVTEQLACNDVTFSVFEDLTSAFSIRVTTAGRVFVKPRSLEELVTTIKICQSCRTKYVIIGNGTKILPPDGIINAVVIKPNFCEWNSSMWEDDRTLRCGSGVQIRSLCEMARGRNFVGVERLSLIPCCVGGGICMNAGAHGQAISDRLISVTVLDADGSVREIDKRDLGFKYRSTSIPKGYVILRATFRFKEQANDEFFLTSNKYLSSWRQLRQPRGMNFGSVFKNGENFYAGELVDKAGMKGKCVGGACVSNDHANFIVNQNNATARDIETLINWMRYEVFVKFNKYLETEINFLRP